jgi:hypothetical protein
MKRLLVGCLVVVIVGVAALAVGAFLLYRAASPMIEEARTYVAGLAELGELEKQITNAAAYSPPPTSELTEDQVTRFVQVQDNVRAALGQRMTEIEEKYKHLDSSAEGGQPPSFAEAFRALGDIATVFVQARRHHVAALNLHGFSQAEYAWVRSRVLQAAGVEVANMIDLSALQQTLRENTGINPIETPRLPHVEIPARNRELVKPHLDRVQQWLPLAFFGL